MRAWRPLSIAAVLLCTAAAAEPEYWGDSEFQREYGDTVAVCAQHRGLEPPAGDRPSAAELAALGDCDSADAWYGVTGEGDPDRARRCAFAEMARGENDGPAGAGILMSIYAEGRGAKRNLPYAIKLVCTVGGAPFEVEARIAELKRRMAGEGVEEPFDYCDHITSGYASGQCAALGARHEDERRRRGYAALSRDWTPPQTAAWQKVVAAETAYADAMTDGEIDLSGTARGAFAVEAENAVKDHTLGLLEALREGALDPVSPAEVKASDARLNAAWKKVTAHDFADHGTVTLDGVRSTQRAWIRYRDAWTAFTDLISPRMTGAVADYLTRERTNTLLCLIGDEACVTPEGE